MLKFTPEQFRSMTINEFKLALDGHLESQGIKVNKMTWADVEEIEREYNIPRTTYSIKRKK